MQGLLLAQRVQVTNLIPAMPNSYNILFLALNVFYHQRASNALCAPAKRQRIYAKLLYDVFHNGTSVSAKRFKHLFASNITW